MGVDQVDTVVASDIERLCSDLGFKYRIWSRFAGRVILLEIEGEISEIIMRTLTDRDWKYDTYGGVFVLTTLRL